MVASRPLPPAAMSTPATRPPLDELLCTALAVGLVLVALVPAARGMGALGWWPMWLVGMPAVAWWASHGFLVPKRRAADAGTAGARPRRLGPQASRSTRVARRARLRAAA